MGKTFNLMFTMKTFKSFLKAAAAGILLLGVSVSALKVEDAKYTEGDETLEYHRNDHHRNKTKPSSKRLYAWCRILSPYIKNQMIWYNVRCYKSTRPPYTQQVLETELRERTRAGNPHLGRAGKIDKNPGQQRPRRQEAARRKAKAEADAARARPAGRAAKASGQGHPGRDRKPGQGRPNFSTVHTARYSGPN